MWTIIERKKEMLVQFIVQISTYYTHQPKDASSESRPTYILIRQFLM